MQPCIPCPSCDCLFSVGGWVEWHQLFCITHRQSSILRGVLPPTLPCFPPSLTWTWIAFINIIDVFHLGFPHPCFYHYIPYVLQVDIQQPLHIFLSQLTFNPSDVVTWHVFLLFPSWCLSSPPQGGEKGHQETCACLHHYMGDDWETI